MKPASKFIFYILLIITKFSLVTISLGESDSIQEHEAEKKDQPDSLNITGTWKREDGWFFIFNDDGTFTHVSPQETPPGNGWDSGKWEK